MCIKTFVSYEKLSHTMHVYTYVYGVSPLCKQNNYISIINQGLRSLIHVEDIACSWHRLVTDNSTDTAELWTYFTINYYYSVLQRIKKSSLFKSIL